MGSLLNLKKGSAVLQDLQNGSAATHLLGVASGGTNWYVDPANGSDADDGRTPGSALATITEAHSKATANQHDVVWYIAGSSGMNLSAALTWSKNYTHLIGVGAPTRAAQRARIFQLSSLTGASPLLTISATGCVFQNFYIFQGVNDATSLINVSVTGGRNYFENVHFAGGGHAAQAIDGGASLKLDAAEENTFVNCTIGVDTIDAATGMVGLLLDGEAHRNIFENCNFTMKAGSATAAFIEVVDSTGFDRYTIFKNCLFTNTSATAMTEGIVMPAGVGLPRVLYFFNSYMHGATDYESNTRGVVFISHGTKTGGTNAGLMLVNA